MLKTGCYNLICSAVLLSLLSGPVFAENTPAVVSGEQAVKPKSTAAVKPVEKPPTGASGAGTDSATNRSDDEFAVQLDLHTGRIDKRLPIDTWFELYGEIPISTKCIHVFARKVDLKAPKWNRGAKLESCSSARLGSTSVSLLDEDYNFKMGSCWGTNVIVETVSLNSYSLTTDDQVCYLPTSLPLKPIEDDSKKRSFVSIVPPLDHNERYNFDVLTVSNVDETTLQKIRSKVADSVDQIFSNIDIKARAGVLGVVDEIEVCKAIKKAIRSADPSVVIDNKSIYSKCDIKSGGPEVDEFLSNIFNAINAYTSVNEIIPNFVTNSDGLEHSLNAITSDESASLLKAIQSTAKQSKPVKEYYEANKDPLLLLRMDKKSTSLRSQGAISSDGLIVPKKGEFNINDSARIKKNLKQLKLLSAQLKKLKELSAAKFKPVLDEINKKPPDAIKLSPPQSVSGSNIQKADDFAFLLTTNLGELAETIEYQDKAKLLADAAISDVKVNGYFSISGNTRTTFLANRTSYVSMDAGFAYLPEVDDLVPYIGANFYFRPINTNLSMAELRRMDRMTAWHKWSVTVGLTMGSIAQTGRFDDSLDSKGLLLGLGYRMSDVARLSAGAVVIRAQNSDPLISETNIETTPYISLSIDFDAAKALKSLGTLF